MPKRQPEPSLLDRDREIARRHITKAERSQGPMNYDQRVELLRSKTTWKPFRIGVAVQSLVLQ